MDLLFWDASALAKRYVPEVGSETADAVFQSIPATTVLTTLWSYAETFSILRRKSNDRRITRATYDAAVLRLEHDILNNRDAVLLSVEEHDIISGLTLIRRHAVNATDAALLSVLIRHAHRIPASDTLWLVVANKRLIRAATAEGIRTLNPEEVAPDDLPSHLTGP